MNNNLNFEAVKGYHLNLRKLNDDQTKFITENLIKDSRDFEGNNNLFHYGYSTPNNEYRFFNFTCFSLGQESEEISFDEFVDKLNIPNPEYEPKDVAFNNSSEWNEKLTKENPWSIKVTEEMMNPDRMSLEEFETECGQNFSSKPIIGYKLIKPEYKEAVREILKNGDSSWFDNFDSNLIESGYNFVFCDLLNSVHNQLEKAGVMHWFEAVYNTSITLKSGVKLSEDDIAEVKEILNNK